MGKRQDKDLQDLINSGLFNQNSEEARVQEALALPIREGDGTSKSIWDRILYPFRVWKHKRREAEIRKNLFKN